MASHSDLRRQVIHRIEALRRAGVTTIPRYRGDSIGFTASPSAHEPAAAAVNNDIRNTSRFMEEAPMPRAKSPLEKSTSTSVEPRPASVRPSPPTARKETTGSSVSGDTLDVVRSEVAACTRCRELACTRTQTVFGVGNPQARLCFLGEAPGADEDRRGEPFVGRAGQLLDKIIEACTLKREDVYILNILKCRPPGNRNPEPEEAANCRPFLDRQLELIRPEFLCCLGAVAARNLLASEESIGKMRGRVFDYHGIKVVCTYHPAYLLRNPSAKKDTWEDMQMLMKLMGIELPSR